MASLAKSLFFERDIQQPWLDGYFTDMINSGEYKITSVEVITREKTVGGMWLFPEIRKTTDDGNNQWSLIVVGEELLTLFYKN